MAKTKKASKTMDWRVRQMVRRVDRRGQDEMIVEYPTLKAAVTAAKPGPRTTIMDVELRFAQRYWFLYRRWSRKLGWRRWKQLKNINLMKKEV